MKLRVKLAVLFSGAAVVPLILFGLLSISNLNNILIDQEAREVSLLADIQSERVKRFITLNLTRLGNYKVNSDILNQIQKSDSETKVRIKDWTQLLSDLPRDSRVVIVNDGGVVADSSDGSQIGVRYPRGDIISRAKTGDVVSFEDLKGGNQASLYVAGPISLKGAFAGEVIIEMTNEEMLSIFTERANENFAEQIGIGAYNQDGSLVMITPVDNDEEIRTQLEHFIKNKDLVPESENSKLISSMRRVESTNLGLVVWTDKNSILVRETKLRNSLIGLLGIVMVYGLLMAFIVAKNIASPIQKLVRATRDLGNKSFKKVNILTNDEIGELGNSFNTMSDNLSDLYMNLEAKVAEKTEELNQKLAEAEKLNSLMIGRELKMIELKKQIKTLEAVKKKEK